jgi:hypothetical protein
VFQLSTFVQRSWNTFGGLGGQAGQRQQDKLASKGRRKKLTKYYVADEKSKYLE